MYAKSALVLLVAASAVSASIIAERIPLGAVLVARSTSEGWSLQSSSAPDGAVSCGKGSFCPSGLSCNPAATAEVAACCKDGKDCRGTVEGAPVCADSSWSLWKGLNGNGFCCKVGEVGIYDYHNGVAGSCVASAAADATTAQIMSTGSGSAPASQTSATAAPASTAAATTAAPASGSSAASSASAATSAAASSAATSAASAASNGTASSTTSAGSAKSTSSGAQQLVAGGLSFVALMMGALAL